MTTIAENAPTPKCLGEADPHVGLLVNAQVEESRRVPPPATAPDAVAGSERDALDRQLGVLFHATSILRSLRVKRSGEIPQ